MPDSSLKKLLVDFYSQAGQDTNKINDEFVGRVESHYKGDYKRMLKDFYQQAGQDTNKVTDEFYSRVASHYKIGVAPTQPVQPTQQAQPVQQNTQLGTSFANAPSSQVGTTVTPQDDRSQLSDEEIAQAKQTIGTQRGEINAAIKENEFNTGYKTLDKIINTGAAHIPTWLIDAHNVINSGSEAVKEKMGAIPGAVYDFVTAPVTGTVSTASQLFDNLIPEEAEEKAKTLRDYQGAKDNLRKAEKILDVEDNGHLSNLAQGITLPLLKDIASVGLNETQRVLNEAGAFDKAKKGEQLTDAEQKLLESKAFFEHIASSKDLPLLTDIGNAISVMAPYVAEFALTGGAATGTKAAIKGSLKYTDDAFGILMNAYRTGGDELLRKTAKEIALKNTLKQGVAYTGGAVAQAGAMAPSLTRNVAERTIGQVEFDPETNRAIVQEGSYEGLLEAMFKGSMLSIGETFGEGALSGFVKKGATGIGGAFGANPKNIEKFFDVIGNNKLLKKAGVGNVVEEFGEEHITALIQNTVEGDWKSFYTLESQLTLAGSVLGMQGGFSAIGIPLKLNRNRNINKRYTDAEQKFNALPEDVKQASQYYIKNGVPSEQAKGLSSLYNEGVIKDEHKDVIVNYVFAKALKDGQESFKTAQAQHKYVSDNVRGNLDREYGQIVNKQQNKIIQGVHSGVNGTQPVFVTAETETLFTVKSPDGSVAMVPKEQVTIENELDYTKFQQEQVDAAVFALVNKQVESIDEEDSVNASNIANVSVGTLVTIEGVEYRIQEVNEDGVELQPTDGISKTKTATIQELNDLLNQGVAQTEKTVEEAKKQPVKVLVKGKEFQALPTENGFIIDHEVIDLDEAETFKNQLEKQFKKKFTVEVSESPIEGTLNSTYNFHLRPITNEQNIQGVQENVKPQERQEPRTVLADKYENRNTVYLNEQQLSDLANKGVVSDETQQTATEKSKYRAVFKEGSKANGSVSLQDIDVIEELIPGYGFKEIHNTSRPAKVYPKAEQDFAPELEKRGFSTSRMEDFHMEFHKYEDPESLAMDIIQSIGGSGYPRSSFPVFTSEAQLALIQENIKQHRENGMELLTDTKKVINHMTNVVKSRVMDSPSGKKIGMARFEEVIVMSRLIDITYKNPEIILQMMQELYPDNIYNTENITNFIEKLSDVELYTLYNYAKNTIEGRGSSTSISERVRGTAEKSDSGVSTTTEDAERTAETDPVSKPKPKKTERTAIQKRLDAVVAAGIPRNAEEEILYLIARGAMFDKKQFISLSGLKKPKDLIKFAKRLTDKGGLKFDLLESYFEEESNKKGELEGAMDLSNLAVEILNDYTSKNKALARLEELTKIDPNQGLSEEELAHLEAQMALEEKQVETVKTDIDEKLQEVEKLTNSDPFAWMDEQAGDIEHIDDPFIDEGRYEAYFKPTNNNQNEKNERAADGDNRQEDKRDSGSQGNIEAGSSKDTSKVDKPTASESQEITALREKIAELRDELKKLNNAKAKALVAVDNRNGLFGDTAADDNDPFKNTFQVTQATIDKVKKPFDDKIAAIKREIDNIQKTIETGIVESKGQKEIEIPKEPKIKSWLDKWGELKQQNNTEELDLFYNKVKVALNGYAQGKGEDVVKEFEALKKDIEQFAKDRKQAEQPRVETVKNPLPGSANNQETEEQILQNIANLEKEKLEKIREASAISEIKFLTNAQIIETENYLQNKSIQDAIKEKQADLQKLTKCLG